MVDAETVGSWPTERTLMDGYRSLTLPTLIFDKPVSREQVAVAPGTIFDELLDLMRKIEANRLLAEHKVPSDEC